MVGEVGRWGHRDGLLPFRVAGYSGSAGAFTWAICPHVTVGSERMSTDEEVFNGLVSKRFQNFDKMRIHPAELR